ncbi:hypothetical protein [Herbidospora sp. RD11066]
MRILPVALTALALLAAACSPEPDYSGQTRTVAAHWRNSPERVSWTDGLVLLQHLTLESEGRRPKWAHFSSGARVWKLEADLPSDAPAPAELRWRDGTTLTVPLLSPAAAYTALTGPSRRRDGRCPAAGCRPLRVTKVTRGETTAYSSRGEVRLPTWDYTVDGLTEPYRRIAVDPSAMGAPPRRFGNGLPAPVSAYEFRSATELRLRYQHGACDTTHGASAYETPEVVVVIVDVRDDDLPDGMGCPLIGREDQIYVTLQAPLGRRVVLDASTGLPVMPRGDNPYIGPLTFDARES